MVNQTVSGTQETAACTKVIEQKLNGNDHVTESNEENGHHVTNGCSKNGHYENGTAAANGYHAKDTTTTTTTANGGSTEGEYAHFDPHRYAQTYYETISGGRDDWDYVPKALKFWMDTFSKEDFSGDELIELGVGPILLPAIFASRRFKRIYLADYAEANLKALRMWIDKNPGAYDWLPFCEYVAKKEKTGATGKEIETRLRTALQDAFFCDINKENPIAPRAPHQYDCVIAAGVLECASKNHEDYRRNVCNIASLVKPGGYILADGDLNENFYYVDDKKFFILNLDAAFIRAAFEDAGFEDLEFLEFECDKEERSTVDMFDAQGYWQLRARKRP